MVSTVVLLAILEYAYLYKQKFLSMRTIGVRRYKDITQNENFLQVNVMLIIYEEFVVVK